MRWQKVQTAIFIIFISAVVASLLLYYFLADEFSLTEIRRGLQGFGIWAPIIFILLYTLGTIFIPSTPFMAAAGVLFGFKYGLLYTVIGGFLSSIIVFSFSRKIGRNKVDSILKNKYMKYLEKYNRRLETKGVWDLIILRTTPIMPFNILNILMGVSKMGLRNYIIGTTLGLIPSNILTVYFGNLISKIF